MLQMHVIAVLSLRHTAKSATRVAYMGAMVCYCKAVSLVRFTQSHHAQQRYIFFNTVSVCRFAPCGCGSILQNAQSTNIY
jgi:hypothetical protein